ncbi:MAG: D-alanyl-D-alanine carboxypeptidase [Solirubrobacteraceae bacterium]|nr:D-alanyl-D-alanine carboxypeptidase [Solirubrobacteraceae bacterium]
MRAAAAALLAAATLAGCGGGPSVRSGGAGADAVMQAANGPVAPLPGPRPLAVKLADPADPVVLNFRHPPRSGLLFDLDTGRVLWRRDPERILPIASLTKMMTALLVVGSEPPAAKVRITKVALHYQGSAVGLLPRGKDVTAETLLYGLLLPSGNDAARALAEKVGGSLRGFVDLMNQHAQQLGLRCTHYTSADGFYDAGNHSCAVDLAAEARAVLDQPRLARIVGSRSAIRALPIKGGKVYLYNNNPLYRLGYAGTIGVKTGYTDAAGHCLVAAVRRHGHRLGVVLLHSPDTGAQAVKLLDRGFRAEG